MKNFYAIQIFVIIISIVIILGNDAHAQDLSQDYAIPNKGLKIQIPIELYSFKEQFLIDRTKIDNTPVLERISAKIDSIVKEDTVTGVNIRGYASIDGPVELNNTLAKKRAEAMIDWLKQSTVVNPDLIRTYSNGEPWDIFKKLVIEDTKLPQQGEVLKIIDSDEGVMQKQAKIKSLQNGEVWEYMAKNIFPQMRVSEVSFYGYPKVLPIPKVFEPVVIEQPADEEVFVQEEILEEVIESEYWNRKIYLKTNAPAWLMLWINAAFEIDIAPHWSFALPVYYSGFNYFKRNLKFRTFSVVPEFRWWPRSDNMGFFLNAHFGMNQFNYAKGGEWRYQTYHGHSPALGGGVGIGYRWYFCKNHRWSMEAGIGAGIYHLDYSIFQNIPNGQIVGRKIRTFYGVDQASLSFVYSFGIQQKKVKK